DLGGFCQTNVLRRGSLFQPAAANLDGLPGDEIVATEFHGLHIVRPDGSSFDIPTIDHGLEESPVTLVDFDGDGKMEFVALGRDGNMENSFLFVWNTNRQLLNTNFPLFITNSNPSGCNIINKNRLLPIDVDGDGIGELLLAKGETDTSFTLKLYGASGENIAWHTGVFDGRFWQFAAADFNHDGLPEIVVASVGSTGVVDVLRPNGSEF